MNTIGHRTKYGASETNAIADVAEHHQRIREAIHMKLKDFADRDGTITRMRMFRENGFYDLSYLQGELPDGTPVSINDFGFFRVPVYQIKSFLVDTCKSQGVYAKKIGMLDEENWSVLRS